MSAKERYDSIIQEIETLATTQYLRPPEIAGIVATQHGLIQRDMATILNFMTESQLISYIRSRQYNAAYHHIITSDTFDINGALMIANVADQPTLIKVFKKHFGLTPKKAFELKDASRLLPKKSWDVVSCNTQTQEKVEDIAPETDTILGVDLAIYERITQIHDLQTAYGLSRDYSILAVHLADTMDIDFNAAFSYVEGFKAERELLLEDEEADEDSISQIMTEEWLWHNAKDPAVQYCYFQCGLSVSSALWKARELSELGHGPVTELSPLFIRTFNEDYALHSHFLREACEYYEKHSDETYSKTDFEFFLDQLELGNPIEYAFENTEAKIAFEESLDEIEEMDCDYFEPDEAFEKWAHAETDYRGYQIDNDYDPDYPYD